MVNCKLLYDDLQFSILQMLASNEIKYDDTLYLALKYNQLYEFEKHLLDIGMKPANYDKYIVQTILLHGVYVSLVVTQNNPGFLFGQPHPNHSGQRYNPVAIQLLQIHEV